MKFRYEKKGIRSANIQIQKMIGSRLDVSMLEISIKVRGFGGLNPLKVFKPLVTPYECSKSI